MVLLLIYIKAKFSNYNFLCFLLDAVHALVCAIMLLNTDLHGQVSTILCRRSFIKLLKTLIKSNMRVFFIFLSKQTINRRMKQVDFVKNLSGMCDGNDYPANLLKVIYVNIDFTYEMTLFIKTVLVLRFCFIITNINIMYF